MRDTTIEGVSVGGDFTIGENIDIYKSLDQCDFQELEDEERLSIACIREEQERRSKYSIIALLACVGVAGAVWLASFYYVSLDAQVSHAIAFATLLLTLSPALSVDRPNQDELEEKERLRFIRSLMRKRKLAERLVRRNN